jgi:hypothetical protein
MGHYWFIPLFVLLLGNLSAGAEMNNNGAQKHAHVGVDTTVGQLISHPAFEGFGAHLLTRESDSARKGMPLRDVASLLPYHGAVDVPSIVASLNHMIDDVNKGHTIFYGFYHEQERRADRDKASTGLFFFRGKPGAPFAVICPGGGFSYVGSLHEGFPYAMELSKRGYNAFVLQYRVGGGGTPAVMDLAAALSFIFTNADVLGVSTTGYSLWGSSAGARMVANIGSHGAARFGGNNLPKPSAVIMAYTGHSDFSRDDPPTFAVVGDRDGIASAEVMENRIRKMRTNGIDSSITIFPNVGHGFGLGVGTSAEGWIDAAVEFWRQHP